MRIGTSRKNITPQEKEFYLLGYKTPLRNKPAAGVHDPIFTNSMIFDDNGELAFLWSADLLELPDTIAQKITDLLTSKFPIKADKIILTVMHNHSSVRDFHDDWPYGKFSQSYFDFFMNSISESFQECLDNRKEAHAEYGKEIVEGYYGSRVHPYELADNEVTVLRFYDDENNPFSAIVNWAVHSTVMGGNNLYLTGDLAGNTCRKLGEKWGYYPVFVNGAAGDCSNRYQREGKDFAELERASSGLCDAIANIPTNQKISLGKINTRTFTYEIHTDIAKYHEELKGYLAAIENGTLQPAGDLPKDHLIDKCSEQLKVQSFDDALHCGVMDIGEIRFFIFPGEFGSALGKRLKQSTDKLGIVAGYSNGFHYYYLAKEDYGLSFETIGNPVPRGEPEKIVEKMIELGKEMN